MNIYQILPNQYLGQVIEVADGTPGIPIGFTRTIPPTIPNGTYAMWSGRSWVLTENPAPYIPVPAKVTMRQFRTALLQENKLTDVTVAIGASSPALEIYWEYEVEVDRLDILATFVQTTLDYSHEQVDNLFVVAAGL